MSIDLTLEQVSAISNDNTIWTTVTNYGYRLYTLNMLKSLSVFGLDHRVLLLCLDQRSAEWFQKKGYHVMTARPTHERFCAWNTPGYDQICYLKLEWIYRILSLGKHVMLMDGDIVFLKNPMNDIQQWESSSADGWIQNDAQHDHITNNLCTGYLYLRSSPELIHSYDCTSDVGKEKYKTCAFDNNDQTYFNKYVKPFGRFEILPLEQYPNGQYFLTHTARIRSHAIMVHFNWIEGHMKMAKMKEHKMWLLSPVDEI